MSGASNSCPNILFVTTDQQHIDTIAAAGCPHVSTPNIDRLVREGVSFSQSYSTNPLCSPARSSWFTGRPTLETGVVVNDRAIRSDIPNIGQWLGTRGYEPVYVGKWHVPQAWPVAVPGFTTIPAGHGGAGNIGDGAIARATQGWIRNRSGSAPFFLTVNFLQPHDICQFVSMHQNAPDKIPYDGLEDVLPELPANFGYDPREPEPVAKKRRWAWTARQWRYYLWSYYRQIEMVDAELGRVLEALDDSPYARNTLVIFTSDHGEGCAHHQQALKNLLYDEAARVPFVVWCPDRVRQNECDREHLVSGLDIMSTVCDYAGLEPPPDVRGRSLRPLLEGTTTDCREFVAAEVTQTGRMIRTQDYKYVVYQDDPVAQLFDMKEDPGETRNLADEAKYADVLAEHRRLLREWEAGLDPAPVPGL